MPRYRSSSRLAFSLLELLLVLIAMGIASQFALPRFTRVIDHSRAETALNNLRAIKTGEEIIQTRTDAYVTGLNSAAEINAALGLTIDDTRYTYDVSGGGPNFSARARLAGAPGTFITIDQAGAWGGTSPFVPNTTE